ncbi:MAG TPA: regulatory iron-sulfur-containing complex subunit RicT [candidate division Zixibacteria bacterium]|nr:regulatory iron-sulfur-containing complex subunit RicT [candidate division Zixibacteria bacterium]
MAELYLVEFKGSRREYFYNTYYHSINQSDYVIVQAERGENIGLVRTQVEQEVDFTDRDRPGSILRPASEEDKATYRELQKKEDEYRDEVIEIIARHGLAMKVVDVELQFDGNKMTVYFTADHRVDFRELVKDLAARYRTRIELRQIGVRDEARRIGGYGICGMNQCCNTFIRGFEPISTQHAREQDLPLNPSKISGNCGRLLCCLRYEADVYAVCKKKFPPTGKRVMTKEGEGVLERIDVFHEEGIIRGDDNVRFRCQAKDIEWSNKESGENADDNRNLPVDVNAEPVDEEELKMLEDEDNSEN